MSNLEVFPISVYFVHMNTDPGTGGVNFVNYANGPYGRQIQLASSNAQKSGTTTMSHSIRQIVGDQTTMTDTVYQGTSASNPTDLTYFGVGLQSALTNLTNGVWISGHIEFTVDFYDRKNTATWFPKPPHSWDDVADARREVEKARAYNKVVDPRYQAVLNEMVIWKQQCAQCAQPTMAEKQ